MRDGVISQKDAYVALNAEIEKNIEAQKDQARFAARDYLSNYNFDLEENKDAVMFSRNKYNSIMSPYGDIGNAKFRYDMLNEEYNKAL